MIMYEMSDDDFLASMDELDELEVPGEPLDTLEEDVTAGGESHELSLLELTDVQLHKLICQDSSYASWLRLVLLRIFVHTPVLGRLNRPSFSLTQVCDFLGLGNFDKYAKSRTITEIRDDLSSVLKGWEMAPGQGPTIPPQLERNLAALGKTVGLNDMERAILGFAVLVHTESILECGCDLLGSELTGFNIERILAPLLAVQSEAVKAALQPDQKLFTSGLLTVDMTGRFGMRQLLDLLTSGFASQMHMPQSDIRSLMGGFARQEGRSDLSRSDYAHIATHLGICSDLLAACRGVNAPGVNILIYGKPGTGKTEFARVLTQALGLDLLGVTTTNGSGAPAAPIRRLRNYRVAQAFFRDSGAVLLFDECEEILNSVSVHDGADNAATIPRKSWINQMLESNHVPTIWIANSLEGFDEAYIRRFSVCFEMPVPNEKHRLKMISAVFGDAIGETAKVKMARHNQTTPAIMAQAAKVLSVVGCDKSEHERNELAIQLVNDKFQAQGFAKIKGNNEWAVDTADFDPALVNCDADLGRLCESLRHSREGRICLYGPPGTGKTAFGKWVAQALEMPHLNLKVSDLVSAYVGETEQKIAQAFQRAHQQKAVLQLDEVDSFLQDRSKAERTWAVTQVNEMLTQMEGFEGVFIASTNLFDNLDEASLRRFDMVIKMDFMKPEAAWRMFQRACQVLGLELPEAHLQSKIATLHALTPGDFEQVIRRSRLLPPASAVAVFEAMESAVRLKKRGTTQPMGFLAAA